MLLYRNIREIKFIKSFLALALIVGSSSSILKADPQGTQIAKIEKSNSVKQNSLFVVSDEELKTYSSTSELIRELKVLRQDKDTLLDYSKKLREKYKELEGYCSKSSGAMPAKNIDAQKICLDRNTENLKIQNLTKDLDHKIQEFQNLKTEYEALKIQNASIKEDLSKVKLELANAIESGSKSSTTLVKLEESLEQKSQESKSCFEQLEQGQKLVVQIPEMEKEILGLRNELIMRKSAAELLGAGNVQNREVASLQKEVIKTNVSQVSLNKRDVQIAKSSNEVNFSSDMMIVEVLGDKVTLRAGPGVNNSSIMDIAKGAKLTVEAREGDWFRVNSPTGGRAYVQTKYVKLVDKGEGGKTVSMEIDPVKPPLPEKAVKLNSRSQLNSKIVKDIEVNDGSKKIAEKNKQEDAALSALRAALEKNAETAGE